MAYYYEDEKGNLKKKEEKVKYKYIENEKGNLVRIVDTNTSKGRTWFKKGAFEDGYQFGDLMTSVGDTIGDVGLGVLQGAGNMVEGITDLGMYGVAGLSDLVGADSFAGDVKNIAKKSTVDDLAKSVRDLALPNSFLGERSVDVANGLGQVATMLLTAGAGQAAGLGSAGVSALSSGAMFTSSAGAGMSEAYQSGASDEDALKYGLLKGAVDAGSELVFGGLGKTVKGLGISKGISSLDDVFAKKLSDKISNQALKTLIQYGVKTTGEGVEEVLAGLGSAVAKKLTYMPDAELKQLIKDEKLIDQFVVGAITSGIVQGGDAIRSVRRGTDYVTGMTKNEELVVEKEVQNRIAERKKEGKLSNREKDKIYEQVRNDLAKGYISIDTIESALGGDTYKNYVSATEQESALQMEYDTLNKMKQGDMTGEQSDRRAELKQQLEELKKTATGSKLKEQLSREVAELAKRDRLNESYNEKTRRSQAFTADVSKYDAKQQETIKRAVESGILNNTNRTHEFVDMLAKISADKGISFDFTNNKKMKESGFALEGKMVNGFLKNGSVSLNIESVKALNVVVGHEITHVLEGTELYGELQQAVKAYAESKGEYGKRLEALQRLYEGVEGANIENELTADLIGDYLFTDSDFVNRLSTEKPGLFKRIFEEIKYLVKTATAGGKQARELEKVKRAFEKAYKERGTVTDTDVTKYSLYLSEQDVPDYLKSGIRENRNRQRRYEEGWQIIVSTDAEFEEFVMKSIEGNPDNMVAYGKVENQLAEQVKEKSDSAIDITDAFLELLSDDVQHAYQEHMKAKEVGDLDMSATDLLYALKKVNQAEVVSARRYKDGGQRVTLAVSVDDGMVMLVELASKSAGSLRLKTGWKVTNEKFETKYKSSLPSAGNRSSTNAARDNTASDNSIPQIEENASEKQKYSVSDSSGRQLSEGQREYFKDSKVRDENGALLTVYHGTDAKFTTFRSDKKRTSGRLNFGKGFYFSPSKSIAENYSETGNVMSVYVNLKKPYEIYGTQFDTSDFDRISAELGEKVTIDNVSQILQKHGYDGIIARKYNGTTNPVGQVIAFESNQVKSTENLAPTEKQDINLSLSETSNDIAPIGNYNVRGKDIALGPVREDVAPVQQKTVTQENLGPVRKDIAPVEQEIKEPMEDIGPVRSDVVKKKPEKDTYAPEPESYPKKKVTTVKERNAAKLQSLKVQLKNEQDLMEKSHASYNAEIRDLQSEYDSKKNKNTRTAQKLLDRIERRKNSRDNVDAYYEKRIHDIRTKIDKMNTKEFKIVEQRQSKQEEYQTTLGKLMGDISTWVDKKMGIYYKVNTLRRNLRDIVRDENGNRDIAKADAIYDELQGKYNHNEAKLNREANEIRGKYAKLKITAEEDVYIQMLGEYRHNPDTTLTADVIGKYYEKHKAKIDTDKVNEVIASARQLYDELFRRVNAVLEEQGMRPIEYREGYFPHFTDDKQSWLAKLLNWKTKKDNIPTDIAGLTEQFKPVHSYQSFDKHRTGDKTDYSFKKGLDMYVQGALDWIYHIEDIQKRRAFEDEIRYRHSDQGVKDKVEAIRNNPEYDASEVQDQIDLVYKEARNPLNNFISDFRTQTNTLAGKKHSMDRGMEDWGNRKFYSTMQNISNRVSANMVVASFSSALTNFIPIIQSWAQVSPVSSLVAMRDTIKSYIKKDSSVVDNSDFLTNRLHKSKNLYQSTWDKIIDKAGFMMEAIDNFTSQVVWRSKYLENMKAGMSENEAIKNADQFTENVLAGRSRGNNPTIFDAKNPFIKIATAFQLEVNNQYGYLFKDVPQDIKNEAKGNLLKSYAGVFIGSWFYNMAYSALTGRDAALDPIGIVLDVLKDLGFGKDEEPEEPTEIVGNLTESVLEELPFVGGLLGGGRIPISSALPYDDSDGFVGAIKDLSEDVANWKDGGRENFLKELSNPASYLLLPAGGGQIRKTVQGLGMYSDKHPIAGSYTNSGKLRFVVEDTPLSKLQAALFGQWSSKNAREYIEEGRSPLGEKQTQELVDTGLPMADYWKYRDGLKEQSGTQEKIEYIAGLDLPIATKNTLVNNAVQRETTIDMTEYNNLSGYEEFDFFSKNKELYNFLKKNGISYADYKILGEKGQNKYRELQRNPEKYQLSQVITRDVTKYIMYRTKINNITSDKGKNGESINGSRKKKVIKYINSLDIDYGQKLILFRSEYNQDDSYNYEIVEYLNEREDITWSEMESILKTLGFTVYPDGRVTW